jgi:2-polyprenyl-3-methyl-5-hydroxy-6-metoxy-1,4-benzoquinol methylase
MLNEDIFTRIFESNGWGSIETPSGPGSTIDACSGIITKLPFWIDLHSIQTIVDLGCGDFHWMSQVDLGSVEYYGYDIVKEAVDSASRYAASNITFVQADVLKTHIPAADLVICKDVLIHLPDSEVLTLLESIRSSGSRLLASTTSPGWNNLFRHGLKAGEFAPLDLEAEPFSLGAPLDYVAVPHKDGNPAKFLALWSL